MKDYFTELSTNNNGGSESDNAPEPSSGKTMPVPVPTSMETAVVMGIVDITKESIRCFTEYAKCKEHEKTERKRIHATLRAIQYQIAAQKEVYLKELEANHEEREKLYALAEKAQEIALERGDKEMLHDCYNLILNVYNNPHVVNASISSISANSIISQ